MPNPNTPESQPSPEANTPNDASESFGALLSQYEKAHTHKSQDGNKQLQGTVVAITADSVLLDIGFKTEGILPLTVFQSAAETVNVGDTFAVSVKGRDEEGYYTLSRFKTVQPADWSSLEQAFAEKSTLVGTVTAVIKGGFHVDVGVRAFMPASRSGARDAAPLQKRKSAPQKNAATVR